MNILQIAWRFTFVGQALMLAVKSTGVQLREICFPRTSYETRGIFLK